MKLIAICLALWLCPQIPPQSVYSISFTTINGDSFSLSTLRQKKIVVVAFNAANPDTVQLKQLDAFQKSDDKLTIIAVPSIDFGGKVSVDKLIEFKTVFGPDFIMATPSVVKKNNQQQNRLFKWLTNVSDNEHFDLDVDGEGGVFLINESGALFGVFPQKVSSQVIRKALYNEIKK